MHLHDRAGTLASIYIYIYIYICVCVCVCVCVYILCISYNTGKSALPDMHT